MKVKELLACAILLGFAAMITVSVSWADSKWKVKKDHEWCDSDDWDERYCEVREITLPADRKVISIDGSPNGGIKVEGWNKDAIKLTAKVSVRAKNKDRAREIASKIEIITDKKTIYADGPKRKRKENWSVSYRLMVPKKSNLELETTNGGINIEDVHGDIEFDATNGGIHLDNVGGHVRGETTNGGVSVNMTGKEWDGEGLDVRTTNGGIKLAMPDGYSANLEVSTVNGGIYTDFPVTVSGKIGKRLKGRLGDGGAMIRARTTNGGVKIRKSNDAL